MNNVEASRMNFAHRLAQEGENTHQGDLNKFQVKNLINKNQIIIIKSTIL